jgi:Matrixin
MKGLLSKPAVQAFTLLLAVLFLAKTSPATTAIMLSDENLIASSRVILLGDVVSTKAQWDLNHDIINTYVKVRVSRVLKGQLQNEHIVFKQLGGVVGEQATVIFGAPDYKVGRRVLLFLDTARDGTLRVAQLFQGKYDVVADSRTGAARVERKVDKGAINLLGASEGSDITNSSTLTRFTKKIKRALRAPAADVSALDTKDDQAPIVETPPEYIDDAAQNPSIGEVTPQYTFLGTYRWFEPDTGQPVVYRINPASPPIAGGGVSEINQAFAAWTNVQTTALVLQNGGSTTMFGFRQDGVSAISYNDPLDQMSDPVGCSGTLALGGVTSAGGGTRIIGGIAFSHIFEGDVVFNRNFACFLGVSANLAEVATHEIGHSMGFGHSDDPAATMYATAHGGGRGATLGSDDVAVVSFLYPGSKGTPPGSSTAAMIGVYRPSASTFYLHDTQRFIDQIVPYGAPGDIPLTGDWDGNGTATIGLYRPATSTFYLRNNNTSGFPDISITYGASGDMPIVGDWDGNRTWTVGVYRPSTSAFHLRNSNSGGPANVSVIYGAVGDLPVVGDWDGDGTTTIGVYRPGISAFYLRNSNTAGPANLSFQYGAPGDKPIIGKWS